MHNIYFNSDKFEWVIIEMIIFLDKNPIVDILCNVIILALNTMIFWEFSKEKSKQIWKEHKETYFNICYICLQIDFPKFLSSIYPISNFGEIGFTHKAVL